MNWKDQLYNHEIPPPEMVWGKICHDLDNDSFVAFKQLAHDEITPPTEVWEKVCQDLDNHSFITFKEHLQHLEVAPPAAAWNNIENILDEQQAAPVIALKTRSYKRVLSIAAAAAIVGILFFTINNFLSSDKTTQVTTAGTTVPESKKTEESKTSVAPPVSKTDEKQPARLIASRDLPGSKKNNGRNVQAVTVITETGENYESPFNTPLPVLVAANQQAATDQMEVSTAADKRIKNLKGEIREDVSLMDLPNSYFYTTGPNGQSIRVSAKFRNTIQYLNGDSKEELLDVILRESGYWKNIFKEWKEKVAHSSFVPSAQNFMDITELIKLMQQNQRK